VQRASKPLRGALNQESSPRGLFALKGRAVEAKSVQRVSKPLRGARNQESSPRGLFALKGRAVEASAMGSKLNNQVNAVSAAALETWSMMSVLSPEADAAAAASIEAWSATSRPLIFAQMPAGLTTNVRHQLLNFPQGNRRRRLPVLHQPSLRKIRLSGPRDPGTPCLSTHPAPHADSQDRMDQKGRLSGEGKDNVKHCCFRIEHPNGNVERAIDVRPHGVGNA